MRESVDEKNPFWINFLRASKPSFPRPSPMGRYGVDDPGQNDRENLWNNDLFQNHSVRPQELWPIHHSIIIMMIIHHVSIEVTSLGDRPTDNGGTSSGKGALKK